MDREVELKKQSSCSLQLINKTDQYVAFKVFLFSLLFHYYIWGILTCMIKKHFFLLNSFSPFYWIIISASLFPAWLKKSILTRSGIHFWINHVSNYVPSNLRQSDNHEGVSNALIMYSFGFCACRMIYKSTCLVKNDPKWHAIWFVNQLVTWFTEKNRFFITFQFNTINFCFSYLNSTSFRILTLQDDFYINLHCENWQPITWVLLTIKNYVAEIQITQSLVISK